MTDTNNTYTIYTYRCGFLYRDISGTIGYNVADDLYAIYRYSNTPLSIELACINNHSDSSIEFYNLLYQIDEFGPPASKNTFLYVCSNKFVLSWSSRYFKWLLHVHDDIR